jgi:autotransporter-associated beta strand protein
VGGSGGSTYNLGALTDNGSGAGLNLADISSNAVTLSVGSNGASTTYGGVLSGSGGLSKVGSGTMTLTGSNTYTGRTRVLAGELDLNSSAMAITGAGANNAMSSPDVFVNGGTLVTLASDQFASTVTLKIASGTVNFNDTTQTLGDLYNSGGTVDYSGNITFNDPTWRHQYRLRGYDHDRHAQHQRRQQQCGRQRLRRSEWRGPSPSERVGELHGSGQPQHHARV